MSKHNHSSHKHSHQSANTQSSSVNKFKELEEDEMTEDTGSEYVNTEAINDPISDSMTVEASGAIEDAIETEEPVIPVTEHDHENSEIHAENSDSQYEPSEDEKKKITIEFPYSEIVRDRIPKAFEIAESVAEKWVNDEKFENIGFKNPIAELAAIKTLEKAKEVEKKLEEKGVISMAKMGVQLAKFQTQAILEKIKNK